MTQRDVIKKIIEEIVCSPIEKYEYMNSSDYCRIIPPIVQLGYTIDGVKKSKIQERLEELKTQTKDYRNETNITEKSVIIPIDKWLYGIKDEAKLINTFKEAGFKVGLYAETPITNVDMSTTDLGVCCDLFTLDAISYDNYKNIMKDNPMYIYVHNEEVWEKYKNTGYKMIINSYDHFIWKEKDIHSFKDRIIVLCEGEHSKSILNKSGFEAVVVYNKDYSYNANIYVGEDADNQTTYDVLNMIGISYKNILRDENNVIQNAYMARDANAIVISSDEIYTNDENITSIQNSDDKVTMIKDIIEAYGDPFSRNLKDESGKSKYEDLLEFFRG